MDNKIQIYCGEISAAVLDGLKAELERQGLDVDKFEMVVSYPPGVDDRHNWVTITASVWAKVDYVTVFDWHETLPIHNTILHYQPGDVLVWASTFFSVKLKYACQATFSRVLQLVQLVVKESE